MRNGLLAYLGGIVRELGGTALIINGTTDHVHMLIRVRPAQTLADVMRVVKANSSRWVRRKWKAGFRLPDRIWVVQRERIECACGQSVYREPGTASSDAVVSGGVCGVPQEKQDCV
jgi:REP element-mobilizing transposase RayT